MKDYNDGEWPCTMHPMSSSAFSRILEQLKYMSPSQLKCLELQIHESLASEGGVSALLTEDELRMLASLFEPHRAAC